MATFPADTSNIPHLSEVQEIEWYRDLIQFKEEVYPIFLRVDKDIKLLEAYSFFNQNAIMNKLDAQTRWIEYIANER